MSSSLQQAEQLWNRVCFDPLYQPKGRYRTYRDLIVWGMEDAARGVCPVARSILSETEWHRVFLEFLKKTPPQSHQLRDVAFEFADFLKAGGHCLAKKYPYLGELVDYEVAEIKLRFAPELPVKKMRGSLSVNPVHYLGAYRWPVHFIREDFKNPKEIPTGDYRLLLWRDSVNLEIHFLEINPLAATLLEVLQRKPSPLKSLLRAVAKRHGLAASVEFFSEGANLVRDFTEKGMIIS